MAVMWRLTWHHDESSQVYTWTSKQVTRGQTCLLERATRGQIAWRHVTQWFDDTWHNNLMTRGPTAARHVSHYHADTWSIIWMTRVILNIYFYFLFFNSLILCVGNNILCIGKQIFFNYLIFLFMQKIFIS